MNNYNINNHNILITGVAGFIGSHVCNYIVDKYSNYNVIGIDKISECSSLKNIEVSKNKPNFRFIKADITNLDFMNHIFIEHEIDVVMHFAAETHVCNSFGNSLKFTKNNIIGTHVLLEVAKNNNIKRFIHVSTDEVYGSKTDIQSSEESVLDPTNPYSATKLGAECLVKSYYHSFKLPIIITRGNNVFGPAQFPEKLIPKFTLRLLKNLKCNIHGSGNQIRSFLYISDVVSAFDTVLHQGVIGEIYNIGTLEEYHVIDVTHKLLDILKSDKLKSGSSKNDFINYVTDRDFNDQRYFITTDKLKTLGWEPKISFDEGLAITVDWYKNNINYWEEDLTQIIINK